MRTGTYFQRMNSRLRRTYNGGGGVEVNKADSSHRIWQGTVQGLQASLMCIVSPNKPKT